MIKINRLKRYLLNGLLLCCASLVMRTVSVSFNVYVSSKIGSEAMGLLTLTGGIYAFAITFATSGINTAVVKLISASLPYENQDFIDTASNARIKQIMKNAFFYCLIFSITASFILFISSKSIGEYLLGDMRTVPSLRLMSFSLVPISLSSALNGYFCGVRRVYKNVIVQICEQGAKILVVSFLLITIAPSGLEYACIAVVAGGALSEGVCVIVSMLLYFTDRKRHFRKTASNDEFKVRRGCFFVKKRSPSFDNERDAQIIPIALPIGISAYVRSALSTIEHLLIPRGLKKHGLDSAKSLSSYGILHGMVFPVLLFPSAVLFSFSSLLVPELSSSVAQKDYKRIKRIVSRVFSLSLLFSLGVSGVFICYSYEIGVFLYDSTEAGKYIRLLAPLIPLMYLDGSVDAMLKGLGEQIYSMRVNILDSLLSVTLINVLLPIYGIYGYVAVIFITELFNATFSILRLINVTKIKAPAFSWVGVPLICIIVSTLLSRGIFGFNLAYNKTTAIIQIGITSLIYLLTYLLLTSKQLKNVACSFLRGCVYNFQILFLEI